MLINSLETILLFNAFGHCACRPHVVVNLHIHSPRMSVTLQQGPAPKLSVTNQSQNDQLMLPSVPKYRPVFVTIEILVSSEFGRVGGCSTWCLRKLGTRLNVTQFTTFDVSLALLTKSQAGLSKVPGTMSVNRLSFFYFLVPY